MASNTSEFLDPAATVGKLTKFATQRVLNRRHFMGALGIAGAAAGSGLLSARPVVAQQPVHNGYAQLDVLNFLLNIKYLKATYYSYTLYGADIAATAGVTLGTGLMELFNGQVNTKGVLTGTPVAIKITGANSAQLIDLLNEAYYDELNQLINLRSLIGSAYAISRPTIDLSGIGTPQTASTITTSITQSQALGVLRFLEDLSASAFAGAVQYLSGANLTYAAQILATDGLHAGALRLAIIQQNTATAGTDAYAVADSNIVPATATITTVASPGNNITGQMVPDDVAPFDPGSSASSGPIALTTAQSTLASGVTVTNPCYDPQFASTAPAQTCTPTQYGGFFATAGSNTTGASFSGTSGGLIFARTFSQVLSILFAPNGPGTYPAQINTTAAGFFPTGVNGPINTV